MAPLAEYGVAFTWGLPDSKLRLITGHRSEAMSDRYTHYHANDFNEVVVLQEEILENSKVGGVSSAS